MVSVLLKHVIYDKCIDIIFSCIFKNFSQTNIPLDLFECELCKSHIPHDPYYYLCHVDERNYLNGKAFCYLCYNIKLDEIYTYNKTPNDMMDYQYLNTN